MPDPQPAFSPEEQVAFLNRMLEAERAGANALLGMLEEHPRRGEAWAALRRVHADEAHNCSRSRAGARASSSSRKGCAGR